MEEKVEYLLERIAEAVGGRITGDADMVIRGAASFEDAASDEITLAGTGRFLKKIDQTGAGAVIVPENFQGTSRTILQVDNPQAAFARVLKLFHAPPRPASGISPSADTGENFVCGDGAAIAPFVAIGHDVTLGDRVTLHPGVFIGDDVVVGNDVEIFPNVSIMARTRIGNRVAIHAGSVIGCDGFGYAPDGREYLKIPHTGNVRIDDDVEIGACNTIDRAKFGTTRICRGVKTDNLVQIAHNVIVGEDTVIVAQVGISGSVTIGSHVILAGQAGVAGHLEIGDNATVGPRSGISKSVPPGQVVSGAPEMPHRHWLKVVGVTQRLPEMKKKLSELEKRLEALESDQDR